MDIAFEGLIGQSIVVYIDDMTIYSKKISNHQQHLNIFLKDAKSMVYLWILRRASLLFHKENY
jgi:hypothetical protein